MTNPTTPGEFEEAVWAEFKILAKRQQENSWWSTAEAKYYDEAVAAIIAAFKRELVAELEEVIKMIDHLQTPSNVKPTVQGRIQQLQQESNENE